MFINVSIIGGWGSNSRTHKITQIMEKIIIKGLQYSAKCIVENGYHKTARSE